MHQMNRLLTVFVLMSIVVSCNKAKQEPVAESSSSPGPAALTRHACLNPGRKRTCARFAVHVIRGTFPGNTAIRTSVNLKYAEPLGDTQALHVIVAKFSNNDECEHERAMDGLPMCGAHTAGMRPLFAEQIRGRFF